MSEKNTFKQIPEDRDEPAPPKVKKGVKSSMSFIRFTMHIVELYLANIPPVMIGFLSNFDEDEQEETDVDND